MRILVVNPFGDTEFYGAENLARIARAGTEFDVVNIADAYPLRNNQWLYFRYMCTDGTLEKVMWAEKQGYDAVFISCNLDIGLHEARQLVDIPVTATLESAALVSNMMGAGYSLVTVDHQNGKIQEMLLNTYGLHDHFVSQRPFDIDANDLYPDRTPPGEVIEAVVGAARVCVEQDGADVVIPACTLAGSILIPRRAGRRVCDRRPGAGRHGDRLQDGRDDGRPSRRRCPDRQPPRMVPEASPKRLRDATQVPGPPAVRLPTDNPKGTETGQGCSLWSLRLVPPGQRELKP